LGDLFIKLGDSLSDPTNLSLPLGCVFAGLSEFADLTGCLISLRLQALGFRDVLATFGVKAAELIHVKRVTARLKAIPDQIEIIPKKIKVVHSRMIESRDETLKR